jgi:hypothetical protein
LRPTARSSSRTSGLVREFAEPPRRQVTAASFPWLQERLLRGETVIIPRLDDIPSALDRENGRRFGVKSNLSIPLIVGGQTVGALGFTMMRRSCSPLVDTRPLPMVNLS